MQKQWQTARTYIIIGRLGILKPRSSDHSLSTTDDAVTHSINSTIVKQKQTTHNGQKPKREKAQRGYYVGNY